jgi:SAM-dependent methyltransferase
MMSPPPDPFNVFLSPEAIAINRARQDHLGSLGLALAGKRVLEVGAGIGLHTPFFLTRGCGVLVTDGNAENVREIRRRLPAVQTETIDLESEEDLSRFGEFDLVYCYGLLYHLSDPERALRSLAKVCRQQILLETIVALGRFAEVHRIRDFASNNNQAVSGIGCRPTRLWLLEKLTEIFGYGYVSRTQPDYPDFQTDWALPDTRLGYRAVFVGSKDPLQNGELLTTLPIMQPRSVVLSSTA